jgi:hypothetical protein
VKQQKASTAASARGSEQAPRTRHRLGVEKFRGLDNTMS